MFSFRPCRGKQVATSARPLKPAGRPPTDEVAEGDPMGTVVHPEIGPILVQHTQLARASRGVRWRNASDGLGVVARGVGMAVSGGRRRYAERKCPWGGGYQGKAASRVGLDTHEVPPGWWSWQGTAGRGRRGRPSGRAVAVGGGREVEKGNEAWGRD